MKLLICILAFMPIFIPHTQGQAFASNIPAPGTDNLPVQTFVPNAPAFSNMNIKQPALPDFANYSRSGGRGKGIWIAGIIGMGVGAVLVLAGGVVDISAGADEENANSNYYGTQNTPNYNAEMNTGNAMIITGAAVFVAGTGMLIGGLVAWRHSKHGYSLISPKKNQFGVAYNF